MEFDAGPRVHSTATKWGLAGIDFVFAVITEASGSVPRGPGATMVISADATDGSVGGGGIEARVVLAAREMLVAKERTRTVLADLSDDDSLGCGGRVSVFMWTELVGRRCVVFGAGHVAAALCPLLRMVGFGVTVYDPREDRLALAGFDGVTKVVGEFSEVLRHFEFNEDSDLLVMTPDHSYDLNVVRQLVGKRWNSLGVMGSVRKRDGIMAVLRRDGIDEDVLTRIRIPVGLSIGGESPAEIAVSIVAELIRMHAQPGRVGRW